MHFDHMALVPEMQEKVRSALLKLQELPDDISSIETLLSIEPRVVETVGSNEFFSSSDPLRSGALKWSQSLQPPDVLLAALEKGSTAAVHWALRQIPWRKSNGLLDEGSLAGLLPGIEGALLKRSPAIRAQAVRTMLVCLPQEQKAAFLKGLLYEQPDEVIAAAIEGFANDLRESDTEVDAIVTSWLNTSDSPLLLTAGCSYWWLVKSRGFSGNVTDEDTAPFERLAEHPDANVRRSVASAVEGVATPDRPRMVRILLKLTHDASADVSCTATRSLRNADTQEVNSRLRELFTTDQTAEVRRAAIEVLGIFGKDNLALILSAATADKDPSVRVRAVYALRKIGTPEAGAALEIAARDSDPGVRGEAQTQLEWFGRNKRRGHNIARSSFRRY
jgi:HEAT repeat protein